MASFLFSPANSEDLSTGTYYIHLVTSTPNTTATIVADINTSDAIAYQPKILTGLTFNTLKWTFNDFAFPAYTYNTIVTGVVIAKRISNNFFASDPILYYADIQNVLLQPVSLTTGKYTISIKFPVDGVIAFSQYYQYDSGAYVNTESIPKGLMYLLGTRNNTQSFLSPSNNAVTIINAGNVDIFNRLLASTFNGVPKYTINFGSRRIRIGTWGIWCDVASSSAVITLHGSNSYVIGNSTDVISDWQVLGTRTGHTAGLNLITVNNSTYWKYVKVTTNSVADFVEMEFYNSSMYSTEPDLMSTILDSPFGVDTLDKSGWGHTWTNNAVNLNNSLYFNGTANASLSTSTLFNLTNRNFTISLDVSLNNLVSGAGIISLSGGDFPLAFFTTASKYVMLVGTSTAYFYLNNGDGTYPPNPTLNTGFDKLKLGRTLSTFTTTITSGVDNIYSAISSGSVGNAGSITLGRKNTANMNGYIKNVKIVT